MPRCRRVTTAWGCIIMSDIRRVGVLFSAFGSALGLLLHLGMGTTLLPLSIVAGIFLGVGVLITGVGIALLLITAPGLLMSRLRRRTAGSTAGNPARAPVPVPVTGRVTG